ncbi:unnamed protein product [Blepharisma stoltei]|uniref:Uncharacterized protein n=1 Tax=Blepharisma stoltei TaxID=1481888 RepID=A0AAU9JNB2_9CILI|nr:unnamed protein product [Blepharisma stoltei]
MVEFINQIFQSKTNDNSQPKIFANDKQKNRARIILESCGFVRDPSRPSVDIGPIRPHKQQKPLITISSNEETIDAYSTICIRCQSQEKLFDKAGHFEHSDIPCGIYTFTVLDKILSKMPTFSVPVPETIISNCNFDFPMLIKNNGTLLEIKPFKHGLKGLKNLALEMMSPNDDDNNKFSCPKVIIKFPGKIKRLINKLKELPESWPETNQDAVIQRFIRPKGLRATKYRVVLKENSSPKVYIFTNRDRFDSRNDPIPYHKKANSTSFYNESQILHEIKRTVIDHKQILKLLHSNEINPFLRSKSTVKMLDLTHTPPEKMKVFELFNNDYGTAQKKKATKFKSITMTARFTTANELEKCDVYEGKPQSYMKIIEIATHLQDKINKLVLKDYVLTELVLDFLQDHKGNWYFLRIEYGKTKEIFKMKAKPKTREKNFSRQNDESAYLTTGYTFGDTKRYSISRKRTLDGKLNVTWL